LWRCNRTDAHGLEKQLCSLFAGRLDQPFQTGLFIRIIEQRSQGPLEKVCSF